MYSSKVQMAKIITPPNIAFAPPHKIRNLAHIHPNSRLLYFANSTISTSQEECANSTSLDTCTQIPPDGSQETETSTEVSLESTTVTTTTTTTTTHAPPVTIKLCKAKGPWAKISGFDSWCNTNCNHKPPYCPKTHCTCTRITRIKRKRLRFYRRTQTP